MMMNLLVWICCTGIAAGQNPSAPPQPASGVAQAQVQELRQALDAMKAELAEARRELQGMRTELDALKRQAETTSEEHQLQNAKTEDLEQTKVESGSKYHVRLSGMALVTATSTHGAVDDLELPRFAIPPPPGESGGAFAGGVRQSFVDLQLFGPTVGGAKTSAGVTFDFFGGFPASTDGLTSPIMRMRTATVALDWEHTSILAGQDAPFISPRSPTSLASTAYPALSAAGNLWTWTPQLRVEHRIPLSDDSTVFVQGGILDPLTGEQPAHEYTRMPTAGERTQVPAQAFRAGWQRGPADRSLAFAAGAYHAKQDWTFDRTVHAWAVTGDWNVPLGDRVSVSGEIYRGRAIAGFGGGASTSVVFSGPASVATSAVVPVGTQGGWAQVKFKPGSRLELNAAYGQDVPFGTPLETLPPIATPEESLVNRNGSGFVNGIFQARSNVLVSVEYRHLWTTAQDRVKRTADHLSFCAGIVF